jgi:apolipoprotein N-acyltransferase
LICYEAIRHRYVRQAVRDGADVLVNITYDAWFGDTSNPSQHLMLSALQAAQFGVPLVRAATTGISAAVDARGRFIASVDPPGLFVEEPFPRYTTAVYKRTVLTADVKRVRVPTPYTTLGDWFAWLCVLFSCLALVRSLPSRRVDPSRRYRFATVVILVGTACIPPLSWLANPHILLGDWIVWAAAVTALGMVFVRQTIQRRNRIEESLIE